MASNAINECGVCDEEFDDDNRKPRCLPCIHCLCSECIDQLIARNKKVCPFCRRGFDARSARDVGVNTGLLEALKIIKEMKKKSSATNVSPVINSKWRDDFRKENEFIAIQNIDACKKAQERIDTDIKRNNDILHCLLLENKIIKNEIIVEMNDIVTTNEERIHYLQEQNKRLHSQKRILKETQKETEEAIRKLTETNTSKHTATIFDEIEDANTDVQKLMERFKKVISGVEKTQNQIDKAAKDMKDKVRILKEVLDSTPEEDEEVDLVQNLSLMTVEKRAHVTIETLQKRTLPVMQLLRKGRIFALQETAIKQKSARISVSEEGRILLHYLKEEILQPDSYTLKYSDVVGLVDISSRLAFLELSTLRKEKLGRLYIRLPPQTKRADQFSLMCTGELGPTYANTKCLDVLNKDSEDEHITFGDYENQDGSGGKALVPRVSELEDVYMRPLVEGTVGSQYPFLEKKATQFYIRMRNKFGKKLSHSFGIVEKGLQNLRAATEHHPNIKDIVISDCGLVLDI